MEKLSKRELQIMKLIVEEKSSLTISKLLKISIRTVETHRKNIASKVGSSSLVAFTKYGIRNGIVDL